MDGLPQPEMLHREDSQGRVSAPKPSQQNLLKHGDYIRIKAMFKVQMEELLADKTRDDLYIECASVECPGLSPDDILNECESVKRISLILSVHKNLMDSESLWRQVPIGALISIEGKYGHQQMLNDFLHIKVHHIDRWNQSHRRRVRQRFHEKKEDANSLSVAAILCEHFAKEYPCRHLAKCQSFQGHYRDRFNPEKDHELFYFPHNDVNSSKKSAQIVNEKDFVFQEECDKIQFGWMPQSAIGWTTCCHSVSQQLVLPAFDGSV